MKKSFHSSFGRASNQKKARLGIALFGCAEKSAAAACVPLTAHPCADSGIGAIPRAAPSGIAAAAAATQRDRRSRAACVWRTKKTAEARPWYRASDFSLAPYPLPTAERARSLAPPLPGIAAAAAATQRGRRSRAPWVWWTEKTAEEAYPGGEGDRNYSRARRRKESGPQTNNSSVPFSHTAS